MPVYEYYCQACDHEWEREQRISDDPVKTCPKCRARKAKRMISRTSFVLKGGGWYSDLYASKKGGAEATADKETGKGKEKEKGESKPETGGKDAKQKGGSGASGGDSKAKPSGAKAAA